MSDEERLAIWWDIVHLYRKAGQELDDLFIHSNDAVLTMPAKDLTALQRRFVGLLERLDTLQREAVER